MASPYSDWVDSLTFGYSLSFPDGGPTSDNSLPSGAEPSRVQPFTDWNSVSFCPTTSTNLCSGETSHHLPPPPSQPPVAGRGMAKKRHYSQRTTIAPLPPPPPPPLPTLSDVPCNLAEHCHFSPACDNTDCDESTICFDHDAHDRFSCNNDLSWCQDHFKCEDLFPCAYDVCNFDFGDDCNSSCTHSCCHPQPQQPQQPQPQQQLQHAKGCNTTCATVVCSDPTCNEDVLYCCLSDVCPHKSHPDCRQACVHDYELPLNDCNVAQLVTCHPPCSLNGEASCPPPLQDSMSTSASSTSPTDQSEAIQTPTSLHLQLLVEAATMSETAERKSKDAAYLPQRKRRKVDSRFDEQALYEAKVLDQTFTKLDQGLQEHWQDYGYHYSPEVMFTSSHSGASHITGQARQQIKTYSDTTGDVSPEGLICKWHNEDTGTCNTSFVSSEDFHNHVKEHTSTLVGNRGANRDYKCRWVGCDKTDPFGTKNHLDRHMQNHTGFKPFACNICGHRCVTHQQLTNHVTTHTRSKPFVCDFPDCTKSFSVKTALSTHKRTHTNDKPFTCRFCGDRYADSSNLSKHRKTVHEDERTSIPCPEQGCTYRDSRCQRLERHCRDKAHGAEVYSDPMKWAEYTAKWKRKPSGALGGGNGRSRTASVATSSVGGT